MPAPTLLRFRQDLRLHDQAALAAAAREGPVVAVYILDDASPGPWKIGGAQRWWLHHSLAALGASLEKLGSRLILRCGECAEALAMLARETGAYRIHAIRHYEPWWRDAERRVCERLDLVLHDGNQLAPPREIVNGAGEPYEIYTPFWNPGEAGAAANLDAFVAKIPAYLDRSSSRPSSMRLSISATGCPNWPR